MRRARLPVSYPLIPTLHDSLRGEMWEHFKDSVVGEQARLATDEQGRLLSDEPRRYAERTGNNTFAMGQEIFLHPDDARELLHADWREYRLPLYVGRIPLP